MWYNKYKRSRDPKIIKGCDEIKMKSSPKNKILLILSLVILGFSVAAYKTQASYQCAANSQIYPDQASCSAACPPTTAACTANSISVTNGPASCSPPYPSFLDLYAQGNSICMKDYLWQGAQSSVIISGCAVSGGGYYEDKGSGWHMTSFNGIGNAIRLAAFSTGAGAVDINLGGCIASDGSRGLDSIGRVQHPGNVGPTIHGLQLTGSGNTITISNELGQSNTIILSPLSPSYTCPLAGGSPCDASHQCAITPCVQLYECASGCSTTYKYTSFGNYESSTPDCMNPVGTISYAQDCSCTYGATTYDPAYNAACTTCTSFPGACGSASGGSFSSAPVSELCLSGSVQNFTGSGPWSWTCSGVCGGSPSDPCTADTNKNNYYKEVAP